MKFQVDSLDELLYNICITLVFTVLLVSLFAFHRSQQKRSERAAYYEGRYGLDHTTATKYAELED